MANHGKGHFKVMVTDEEVLDLLRRANLEHFDDMLNIEIGYAEDGNYFLVYAGEHRVFECWVNLPSELEFRHGHTSKVGWWIDGFLSSYIVDAIGGTITDDGHDEVMQPDFFKRFPTYSSYLELYTKNMGWLKKKAWMKWNNELDEYDFPREFLHKII